MAKQSQNNQLRYTGLTYDSIKSQFEAVLAADPRFENFTDSSLYKLISNLFIGATDMTNYYIERTAEESYLDTAQHLSSVILNASQIGYVVRRPLGSQANISITVNGPISTAVAGQVLSLSRYTTFNYNGLPYILKFAYTHALTSDEANALLQPTGSLTFDTAVDSETGSDVNIEILQGEVKELIIDPGTQVGKRFQKYNIEDPSFSNYYSEDDLGGGDIDPSNNINLTRVFIVDESNTDDVSKEYRINRRSLTAEQYTVDAISNIIEDDEGNVITEPVNTCLIKTNKDTTVDLYFGDGVSTALGPSQGELIKVQYFSVEGESVNTTGLKSKPVELSGNITLNGLNINSNSEFKFISNLRGGADLEDKESIRLNAPAIFQSLDRLVTKNDYKTYLRSLVEPVQVKYSTAWGEAEEATIQGVRSIPALFNSVILSAMGSMYKVSNGTWDHKDILLNSINDAYNDLTGDDYATTFIESADITDGSSPSTQYNSLSQQAYFDLYIKTGIINYMNYIFNDNNAPTSVKSFLQKIYKRSQATIKNIYVPPVIQGFELTGDIVVKEFADKSKVTEQVQNTLYNYLNNTLNFEKPVYISNITDLLNNVDDVLFSNLKFTPLDVKDTSKMTTVTDSVVDDNESTSNNWASVKSQIITHANNSLTQYLSASISNSDDKDIDISEIIQVDKDGDGTVDYTTYSKVIQRIGGLTERDFYDRFAKPFYELSKDYTGADTDLTYGESQSFKNFISSVNNMMKLTLRNGMLDVNGNIINYSFSNEIPLIINSTTVKYNT